MTRKRPAKAVDQDAVFRAAIVEAGGEMLAPTNPYEVMRFRTSHGVGVVYKNAKGQRTWNAEALAAKNHIDGSKGSLAPVKTHDRRKRAATYNALLIRDGGACFFCRDPLDDDMTIEHLVALCHGGPNHISNLFLAHGDCNRRAGHLSAPEKIAMRDQWKPARRKTGGDPSSPQTPAISDVGPQND